LETAKKPEKKTQTKNHKKNKREHVLSFSSFYEPPTQTLQKSSCPETGSPEEGWTNIHGAFQGALARIKYKQDCKGYKTPA